MDVRERFSPVVVGVNATVILNGDVVGGFLAVTSGTITITRTKDSVVIVAAVPVTAGVFTPMPFYIGHNGGTVTAAGGASGTLGN